MSKKMMKALEVAELLQVSRATAYKIVKRLNEELEQRGYFTIRGKIPEEYLRERYNLL